MLVNSVCAIALALAARAAAPLPGAAPGIRPPALTGTQTATPADSLDRPITHFFQNLGHDIVSLPSARTGSILLVGGGASLFVHPLDTKIHDWVIKQPASAVASFGNAAGGVWAQDVSAIVIWGIGAASGRTRIAHVGADLIRAQALVGILVVPTKILVDRDRPNGGTRALPSGHAAATFATAAVLGEHFGWKAGAPVYALAGLVGWARIRSDNHWLSDVVFGASLGLIAGKTVTAGHRQAWAVVPARTPGGMAVYVVRVSR